MSAPRTELLAAWIEWTRSCFLRARKRYITADADGARATAVEQVVQRGLRTCTRSGEHLYFQRYGLQGFRFDPQRVGVSGRPHWPGSACAWDEYHFLTTADARMGSYADPTEQNLCVFGTELLDEVSDELSNLPGNNGVWTFG